MSESERTPEQIVEAIYSYAAEQMANGMPPTTVKKDLIKQGLDAELAEVVVSNLQEARDKAIRSAGQKNMLFGALWCIGGLIVTAVTYSAASSGGGGGKYVVAWGAILFGAIQFFRGVMQSAGSGETAET